MALATSAIAGTGVSYIGGQKQSKHITSLPAGLIPQHIHFQSSYGRRQMICNNRSKRTSVICAAVLNARCAAEQTQTITRQSSTITVAPVQGTPELDDGGTGFPPRDDDGDGGGGGGGGNWSGGFFFFGFLAFLGLLGDREDDGAHKDKGRR